MTVAKVSVNLDQFGPVVYDPTTNALTFDLADAGTVIAAINGAAAELKTTYQPMDAMTPMAELRAEQEREKETVGRRHRS
jgi:hypothetical protein